jgi:hypothetical protein
LKVVCAWCERDGLPSYLGEREPSEDSATTHGICPGHTEQTLEGLPSVSFPDAEMLIVVHPANPDLYKDLVRTFVGMPGFKVILDRRRAGCQVGEPVRKDRRIRQGTVSAQGYTVVRFKRNPSGGTSEPLQVGGTQPLV